MEARKSFILTGYADDLTFLSTGRDKDSIVAVCPEVLYGEFCVQRRIVLYLYSALNYIVDFAVDNFSREPEIRYCHCRHTATYTHSFKNRNSVTCLSKQIGT